MTGERFVVAGLARARAGWLGTVASWATSGALPVEFVACLSAEELRLLVSGPRPFSAALLDSGLAAVDRDLLALLRDHDVTPLVVETRENGRDWGELGVRATLPPSPSRDELLDVLRSTARPVRVGALPVAEPVAAPADEHQLAPLVAVCGPGGTGASTVAMGLAQGLAGPAPARQGFAGHGSTGGSRWSRLRGRPQPPTAARVLLADLCLRADQAALHDARDIVPGVQELVEAHRLRRLDAPQVRALTFSVTERGYHLLLGCRRPTSWTTIRSRAFEAALDGLRRAFTVVVADVEPEVETEESTGSVDVEERAVMAQTALRAAAVVVVVGRPGVSGVHGLVRCLSSLLDHGIDPERLLPVCAGAPGSPGWRARYTRAVAELVDVPASVALAGTLHLPRRGVEEAVHDGTPLPTALTVPTTRAVRALLDRCPPVGTAAPGPRPVRPGSLRLTDHAFGGGAA